MDNMGNMQRCHRKCSSPASNWSITTRPLDLTGRCVETVQAAEAVCLQIVRIAPRSPKKKKLLLRMTGIN